MDYVKEVLKRAHHYLSAEVAASAGMSLQQLQQFCSGTFFPTEDQLKWLARRVGLGG